MTKAEAAIGLARYLDDFLRSPLETVDWMANADTEALEWMEKALKHLGLTGGAETVARQLRARRQEVAAAAGAPDPDRCYQCNYSNGKHADRCPHGRMGNTD